VGWSEENSRQQNSATTVLAPWDGILARCPLYWYQLSHLLYFDFLSGRCFRNTCFKIHVIVRWRRLHSLGPSFVKIMFSFRAAAGSIHISMRADLWMSPLTEDGFYISCDSIFGDSAKVCSFHPIWQDDHPSRASSAQFELKQFVSIHLRVASTK
jgi:hypothetical protein